MCTLYAMGTSASLNFIASVTNSFLSSTGSAFIIVPFKVTVSRGSSNSNCKTACLSFKNCATPIIIIFAPEKDKSLTIQFRGTFCTSKTVSSRNKDSRRFDSGVMAIRSSFLRIKFVFVSSIRPIISIRSSGGFELKVSVAIAKSREFI